nr:ribonuclease J [Lachnospiraceae bacterium]
MKDIVRIIPLGGFDRIGMNMTVIEYNDSIIVIDCGASFMDAFKYGIDTTIPNISYLTQNIDKV